MASRAVVVARRASMMVSSILDIYQSASCMLRLAPKMYGDGSNVLRAGKNGPAWR